MRLTLVVPIAGADDAPHVSLCKLDIGATSPDAYRDNSVVLQFGKTTSAR